MKWIQTIIFLWALALLMPALANQVFANQGHTKKISLQKTPEGRDFYFYPTGNVDKDKVVITIAWPTRWGYESGHNLTVPHIGADAILTGGTRQYKQQELIELLNDWDSRGFLAAKPNHVVGELRVPAEHLEKVTAIAAEMIRQPQFEPRWIERIKRNFIARQTEWQGKSAETLWAVARRAILGDTRLTDYLNVRDLEAVKRVSRQELLTWHGRTFVQTGITAVVTGPTNSATAAKVIDTLLTGLPKTALGKSPGKASATFKGKRILVHRPGVEKTSLAIIGGLLSSKKDGEFTDLLLLDNFGSGPLAEGIRNRLRASYGLNTGVTNYDRDTRFFYITGEVEDNKLAQATDATLDLYQAYRQQADLSNFDQLRQGYSHGIAKNLRQTPILATVMLELALDGKKVNGVLGLAKKIGEITPTMMQERLLSDYPDKEDLLVIAISPDAASLPGACVISGLEEVGACL